MRDASDDMVGSFRRSDAWLLDWRTEIEGVIRYASKPVHPANATTIDPTDVAGRLGPALTAMAREVRLMQDGMTEWREEVGEDLQARLFEYRSWGARDVLAIGLGTHLQLTREQAGWLADALIGDDGLRHHVERHRSQSSDDT